jgi:competence protein ComEC
MRPSLTRFVVSYGAGAWAGLVLFVPLPVALIAAVVGLFFAPGAGPQAMVAGAAGIGVLSGALAHQTERHACSKVWEAGRHVATVLIGDAPGGTGLTRATVLATRERCTGEIKIRLSPGAAPAGATAVVAGTYTPGAALRVSHVRVLGSDRAWRYAVRERIAARFTELYGERAALVHALTLDRREDLEPRLRRAFADSGLIHLLSISGLHVGIFAVWVVLIGGWIMGSARAWVIATIVCWAYVALLGFPAPATRSAAFVTIRATARLRQRNPSADTVLLVSALIVLAVDPWAATDIGAWLSFAAVWGTAHAGRFFPAGWRRHEWARLLVTSVGATIATAPITAYVFGVVPVIGIVANVIAIPLSALVIPGLFASLASHTLAGGTGLVLAALERVADLAASVPGGRVSGSPGPGFALPWLIGLAAVTWGASVRWSPRSLRRLVWVGSLATGAWCLSALPALRRVLHPHGDRLEVYVLDVGQGDAIAIRTPRNRWMVVDAGPRTPTDDAGRRVVLPFLRRNGVRQLDALVVSHGDADHLGGVPVLERALDPALVLEPGQPLTSRLYLEHLVTVDERGLPWLAARAGDSLVLDSVTVTVLHPRAGWIATALEPNENSVVLRVRYRSFSAILSGDAGYVAERELLQRVGPADLLKVGHHGSAGSTGEDWLAAVRPTVAVISVGQNPYGHPDPTVLGRLLRHGIRVFRTDRGGTVTVRTDGRYFEVIQGTPITWLEAVRCRARILSPLSGSSSTRSDCTRPRPESFPTSSTTSRWLPRSSPDM